MIEIDKRTLRKACTPYEGERPDELEVIRTPRTREMKKTVMAKKTDWPVDEDERGRTHRGGTETVEAESLVEHRLFEG